MTFPKNTACMTRWWHSRWRLLRHQDGLLRRWWLHHGRAAPGIPAHCWAALGCADQWLCQMWLLNILLSAAKTGNAALYVSNSRLRLIPPSSLLSRTGVGWHQFLAQRGNVCFCFHFWEMSWLIEGMDVTCTDLGTFPGGPWSEYIKLWIVVAWRWIHHFFCCLS